MEIQRLTQENNQLRAENKKYIEQNHKLLELLKQSAIQLDAASSKCKYTLSGLKCPHVNGE